MAQYDVRVEVRLEGQQELLFSILSLGYQFRENDVFSFSSGGGVAVEYKVESVKLELSTYSSSPLGSVLVKLPVLKIGVSVVPPPP